MATVVVGQRCNLTSHGLLMFRLRSLVLTVAAIVVAVYFGCGPPPEPRLVDPDSARARVQAIAGCWRFDPVPARAPYLATPLTARFDTVRYMPRRSPTLMSLRIDSLPERLRRIAFWELPEDSQRIRAFWGDGFTGLDLRLRIVNDTLSGRAYETTDVIPKPRIGSRVRAVRVACSAGTIRDTTA